MATLAGYAIAHGGRRAVRAWWGWHSRSADGAWRYPVCRNARCMCLQGPFTLIDTIWPSYFVTGFCTHKLTQVLQLVPQLMPQRAHIHVARYQWPLKVLTGM